MRRRTTAALAASLALFVTAVPPLLAEKCTPRETGDSTDLIEIAVIVDGELVVDSLGAPVLATKPVLENYDIWSVEIICWDQVEERFGVIVRSGAVEIQTKAAAEKASALKKRGSGG
jgi:hypothetical protein